MIPARRAERERADQRQPHSRRHSRDHQYSLRGGFRGGLLRIFGMSECPSPEPGNTRDNATEDECGSHR